MKLGTFVKKLREEKEIKLTEAAIMTGVSIAALSRLERNKSLFVHNKTYKRLAEAYGIDEAELRKHTVTGHSRWKGEAQPNHNGKAIVLKYTANNPEHEDTELVLFMKYMYKLSQLSPNARATMFELIDKLS
jgi:transcriptional regulator with XRE-family HTH domain